jgi:DNA-binding beta-propeller fold protein YncE
VDPKGNIWIADHDGGRVFRISPDGQKIESADVRTPIDVAFDGNRTYVSCGEERVVAVMETDSMKLLGNLAVPWDELELSPKGNNSKGSLCGIVAIPGKGFFVTNEGGQTANQHSTYGRADDNTDFVLGKLYRDAYLDDNEPVLRALEVSEP